MTCVGISIVSYILGGVSIAAGIYVVHSWTRHMAELDSLIALHDAIERASRARAANDGEVKS